MNWIYLYFRIHAKRKLSGKIKDRMHGGIWTFIWKLGVRNEELGMADRRKRKKRLSFLWRFARSFFGKEPCFLLSKWGAS